MTESPAGTIYPICPLPEDQSVNFFLTDDGQSWNKAAARTFFNDTDAVNNLDILVDQDGCADFASWLHPKEQHLQSTFCI